MFLMQFGVFPLKDEDKFLYERLLRDPSLAIMPECSLKHQRLFLEALLRNLSQTNAANP